MSDVIATRRPRRGHCRRCRGLGAGRAPVVTSDGGSVRGLAASGGHALLGLADAAAPTGNLRWRPPLAECDGALAYAQPAGAPAHLASRGDAAAIGVRIG